MTDPNNPTNIKNCYRTTGQTCEGTDGEPCEREATSVCTYHIPVPNTPGTVLLCEVHERKALRDHMVLLTPLPWLPLPATDPTQ